MKLFLSSFLTYFKHEKIFELFSDFSALFWLKLKIQKSQQKLEVGKKISELQNKNSDRISKVEFLMKVTVFLMF